MTLIALALALLIPQAPPPLALLESGMLPDSGYVSLLTIGPDGRWTAPNDQKGELTPEELATVKDAVQRVVIATTPAERCTQVTTLQLLRVAKGEVRFAPVCGPKADPSVFRLLELAQSLTVRRPSPMVVKLDRWRPGKEDRKQSIRLMRDGVWSTDNGIGNTSGAELAELTALFDAAAIEVGVPLGNCRVTMFNDIEVPGKGNLRWTSPCQPMSATLAAALERLFALVGMTP